MITEKAYAKLNLTLEVVKKRSDGYHELKMIMIPIELHDKLIFKLDDMISLESDTNIKDNAILKTAFYIKEKYNVNQGAHIYLEKHIPIGGGLAGGSADIAATIRGLNKLWSLNLTIKELEEIAISLGSDTLFCLHNKPAYVYGRGDHLLFLPEPPFKDMYIFPFNQVVLTKEVFENHAVKSKRKNNFDKVLQLYMNQKTKLFLKHTFNDLEDTTTKLYNNVDQHKRILRKISKFAMMSGSGATFFIPDLSRTKSNLNKTLTESELFHIKTCLKH